jgi:hypothetical protein
MRASRSRNSVPDSGTWSSGREVILMEKRPQ